MAGELSDTSVRARKTAMRQAVLARRDAMPDYARATAENAIRTHLVAEIHALDGVVSGFLPIRSEVDITPVLFDLMKTGRTIVLPVVIGKDQLEFRLFDPDMPLVDAGFGTVGPGPDAPVIDPQILITPLAAFDRRGMRLGYGAGHYDRAFARLDAVGRTTGIGVGFATQEEAEVPGEGTDRLLDAIVTETGIIRPEQLA